MQGVATEGNISETTLKPPSRPPQILAPFLMGKRLTLLPECRECTSACPNKPVKRKMQHEQTLYNEGCQNKSGRCTVRTWLSTSGLQESRKEGSDLVKSDIPNSPPAEITGNLWDQSQGCLIVL